MPLPTNGASEEDLVKEMVTKLNIQGVSDKISDVFRHKQPPSPSATPILTVEFKDQAAKFKLLAKDVRTALENLPSSDKFHGVNMSPDRTFQERSDHKYLLNQATAKNLQLTNQGITNRKYIVRRMRLEEIKITTQQDT